MTALLAGLAALIALATSDEPAVDIEPLADGVWLHTSYIQFDNGAWIPTSGLLVQRENALVLVDTAWNDAQTETILNWAEAELDQPVTHAILTHAHSDKMGGVGLLHQRAVDTYAHALSNTLAPERDLTPAEHDLDLARGASIRIQGLDVLYPGAGHATDNIVVYDPQSDILFGGCMIRPGLARTLGNTADGDVGTWDSAVRAAQTAFPDTVIVVPSHGPPGGPGLLDHTIHLVETLRTPD